MRDLPMGVVTMAIDFRPEDDGTVDVVEDGDDLDATIIRELGDLGLTFDQLAGQAESDDFTSERGRRLWFMIAPIGRATSA